MLKEISLYSNLKHRSQLTSPFFSSACRSIKIDLNKALIVIPVLIVLYLISNLSEIPLSIVGSSEEIDDFTVEYLQDVDESMTIDDIIKTDFSQKIPKQFALGYRQGAAWFKITIENQSPNDQFVLYFTEIFWTTLDLYVFEEGKWVTYKNGLNASLNNREIQQANPAFPLEVSAQQTATYYIRGTTVSSHIGEFQLFTEKEFYRPSRIDATDAFNIYSGILFFTMLLTSLLYFVMRERLYLYYAAYVLSFLVWISTQSGAYLYIGIPGWTDALHAIGTLVVFFLVLFSRELLELKKHVPLIDRFFKIFAAIILVSGLGMALEVPHINLFFNIVSSLFFMLSLIVSIKAWIHNYVPAARYYLIALIIYMPTMALMTLTYNGFIPNVDVSRYAFTLGSFVEILFFSLILVNKFLEAKNQKLAILDELVNEKETHSHYLEREVEKRTSELNEANKKLMQQTRELEQAKIQLSIEATTDPLSTLSNRRYFLNAAVPCFNRAKESKQPLSLLMIDIDRFKGINDNFGHDAGDKAIVACAEVLKNYKRDADIVSRYGGEEFVILMPQSTLEDALLTAEHIRKEIDKQQICSFDGKNIFLTVSIGVTQINPEDDNSIADMLKRADNALYTAKSKGRNKVLSL